MARVDRHPEVKDYIVEMTLGEIQARGGVADLSEDGQLIVLADYRLPIDHAAFDALDKRAEVISDLGIRRKVKKLTDDAFLAGKPPRRRSIFDRTGPARVFNDRLRQTVFDVLCRGDPDIFDRTRTALKVAHDEMLRIFGICFPSYNPFRFIPSIRLTQTLFENLHWDNHSIDDDFHQARLFGNLDARPRIWHVSHHSDDYLRLIYDEFDLGRFAGKDPNLLLEYIHADLLGGLTDTWMEHLPKHKIAFESGEVWSGESRLISHQIFYGEAAAVFMWFMKATDMVNPKNRFNERVAAVHRDMAGRRSYHT
ncbi:hypothetical protein M2337_002751 [Sphingobium sp. B2D3A]|uniref:hypothetical protein n=1 Tax=unclassified Sphingobium TaxID=2611147 RepID=UPI00222542EA|nr:MULTISPECIES: hypothetical protein [unclassified Sphingobium]MCW2338518.1 hypothetical protein [Sphingobium sp. B2D3A]MCW2384976.1 hypothetical protein [Sphingobium sp. B2D3D]